MPTEEWEVARAVLDTRLLRVQAPVLALVFAPEEPGAPEGSHTLTCVMGDKQIRRYKVRPLQRCTKLRIATLRFGTGRHRMVLERWTHPKPRRRTCSLQYGLPSCRGESAGVAKRPRERSPTRNP